MESLVGTVMSAVHFGVGEVASMVQRLVNTVMGLVEGAMSSVVGLVEGTMSSVMGLIECAMSSVSSFVPARLHAVFSSVQGFLEVTSRFGHLTIDALLSLRNLIIEAIQQSFGGFVGSIGIDLSFSLHLGVLGRW